MQIDTNTPAQFLRPGLIRQGLVCAAKVLSAGNEYAALSVAARRLDRSATAELVGYHDLAEHDHPRGHDHLGASQCWVYAQSIHDY